MKFTALPKIALGAALCMLGAITAEAREWLPDSLGAGFEKCYIDQGRDYSGPVRSTVIRLDTPDTKPRRGVLYVHGFNDYYFNPELADSCAGAGFAFYAVDLRKYGRSIMPGQKPFECRSLKEYFPDIDSALCIMRQAGVEDIALMGHSTGGLITAYFMQQRGRVPGVKCLVLNSPFLDWNLGEAERFVPAVSAVGRWLPRITVNQGDLPVYGESIDSLFHGEWNYNRAWKMHHSPDVTTGWIHAIHSAQNSLKRHKGMIKVPILLMYSAESFDSSNGWFPDANRKDAVLDVADIRRIGVTLGPFVTPVKIVGGMHDLLLSAPDVRREVYPYMLRWISDHDR